MAKEFGPVVHCTLTDEEAYSHRPGSRGPFFCGNCGDTDHAEAA